MAFEFRILTDDVVTNDLFKDKTHKNSADTLHKVIESTDKNITVGLEGAWGSGKSTVINMLHEKLKQNNQSKTLFFLFDAWAHKDDPLRKIFLESLVEKINADNPNAKHLEDTQHKIVEKIKTIDTKSQKSVSPLGKLLAVSAMVVPLGTVLIRSVKPEELEPFILENSINWAYIFYHLGFLLVISPILVMLYWFLWGENANPEKKFWFGLKKSNWDFFTRESTEITKQDIAEQGEKTSIEFQRYFDEIIKISLEKYNYKQVIIVIDNLDRVDSDQAKSVWSTLQTFFQSRSLSQTSASPNKKVIFLVPYDKEGFSAIWAKSNDSSEIASSFLDKCFQIRVEVPKPISSGWLNYCEECINEALIGWDQKNKALVKEEYSRILTSKNTIPTPRQIRSWVNQIAMNGYKWKDLVSPKALAIYSYERLNKSEKILLDELLDIKSPINQYIKDIELKYEISGLLFGVSKQRGSEILLHSMIEKCFENIPNAQGKLREIIEQHQQVFRLNWNHLKTELFKKYNTFDDDNIKKFTDYINGEMQGSFVEEDLNDLLQLWKDSDFTTWNLTTSSGYANTLKNLIDALNQREQDITWLHDVTNKMSGHLVGLANKLEANSIKELKALINLSNDYGKTVQPSPFNKLSRESWYSWAKVSLSSNTIITEILPNIKEFKNWSIEILNNPQSFTQEDFQVLIFTLKIINKKDYWEEFITKLTGFFTHIPYSQKVLNINEIYDLSFLLTRKFKNIELILSMKSSLFIETLANEEYEKIPSSNYLMALIYEDDLFNEKYNGRNEIRDYWSTSAEEKIRSILDFCSKISDFHWINTLARDLKNKLAQDVLIKNVSDISFTSNSDDIRYIDEIDQNINREDFISIYISNLCQNSSIDDELPTFKEDPIVYATCFKLLLKYGTLDAITKIKLLIKDISSDIWLKDLKGEKSLLTLFSEEIELDHKFSEALADWLEFSMLNNDESQNRVWENFSKIETKILDKQKVYDDLKAKYFSHNIYWSNESSPYVADFWENLNNINEGDIEERIKFLLDNNQWDTIKWITKIINDKSISSERIESRVEGHLDNPDTSEEIKEILEHLKGKLSTKITDKT